MRIAMWSGPRNLSTAMMYAFGNRTDFSVMDEPFYAPFLAYSGQVHPMQTDILAQHETDPTRVERACLGSNTGGASHVYMKHMPHHMLPDFPLDWAKSCVNVHLIRHPARVIASYSAKRETVSFEDIGFAQQAKIYEQLGGIVIDSAEVRANPEVALKTLCDKIDLPFDPAMLAWKAGPRVEDGVWAKHWYGAVHRSTGFAGAEGPLPSLTGRNAALLEKTLPFYEKMFAARVSLTPTG